MIDGVLRRRLLPDEVAGVDDPRGGCWAVARARNSALATGTTRSWRPLMIVTGVVICGSSSASCGQLLGVSCGRSASTRRSDRPRSRRGSRRGSSSATPPAIVSIAVSTITCGSMRRYLSRSGSSTHERSGSPSSSGTAAPPVPTIRLAKRSGWAAAANRAADVPTSGATRCGRSEVRLGDELGQELAHRARREEVVAALGRAEPRQVDGEQAGVLGERGPHRRERVQALRPRARQQQRRLVRAAAVGVADASGRRSSGTVA